MKLQLVIDSKLVAEALTTVEDTTPRRCGECGALKARTFDLAPLPDVMMHPATRVQIRMVPE